MNFIKTHKLEVAIMVAIVVLIIFVGYMIGSNEPVAKNSENLSGATSTSAVAVKNTAVKKAAPLPAHMAAASGIKVATPALGESWTLGGIHTIRWTTAAGSTGSIQLLNASNRQVIGWITPNISATQTFFDWDTRMISIGRTDPSRKDIAPGNYILKIVFDSSRTPVESVAIPIISSTDEKILTHMISIQNGNFVPNSIFIKAGESVILANNDESNADMTVQMNNVSLMVLPKNSSYVFKPQSAGTYEVRLKEIILAKLTVTVR